MIVKTLVENIPLSEKFNAEHGLSLYVETKEHKILFDVGTGGLFTENAHKLGVDISAIDFLVISHGHYDHGGGLEIFLEYNKKAKVFIREEAFGKIAAVGEHVDWVGLDEKLKNNKRIQFSSNNMIISDGIELFSNIKIRVPQPLSNSSLMVEKNGKMIKDTFNHEQNLIIEEDGKVLLITGCAHNGIINIVEHYYDLKGRMPDVVIGGFHLSSRSGNNESLETVGEIGKHLLETKAKYYTCHCTGVEAYDKLKVVMGKQVDYLACGSEITI